MKFTKLIPNVFYTDIQVGLKLFVQCLQFEIVFDDLTGQQPCCVVQRDNLAVSLIQNPEFADKDRPELRLQTDNIDKVYTTIKTSHPELLHPNGNQITLKPWGSREFALLDESGVCIIIQQW